ncbi:hypothetical protein DAPPUDRAFT_234426 [Daphnia pulex]|uniref:Uncharacterized protein n=1 Tax=Daphnia pulex TaxID=6669 RepID=E9FWL0_DAPPU|nr:hypothetical protein DAPPUDRAFT_234426 [Daphnia pulex]|eukprot:EFX88415.1 hypothetical protein DAPPUDRAFT_234426 [Daphnia pulex]
MDGQWRREEGESPKLVSAWLSEAVCCCDPMQNILTCLLAAGKLHELDIDLTDPLPTGDATLPWALY